MILEQEDLSKRSCASHQKLLSLVYPTFKRPRRVDRILHHYSEVKNPNFEVVLSNNDKSISFQQAYRSCEKFTFVDNLRSSRGGDNAINGIKASKGKYFILISDEDLIIGLEEICSWLIHESPSLFMLPVINETSVQRPYQASGHFSSLKFDTYISGMGFERSLVSDSACNDIMNSTNNDYVHIMLAVSILDRSQIVSMTKYSYVVRDEVYHEGKADYFKIRHDSFGWEGRSLQRKSLEAYAMLLGNSELMSFVKKILPESVFIGCFQIYGIRRTFREAAAIDEFEQALTIFRRHLLTLLFTKGASKLLKIRKIFPSRLIFR